MSIFAPRTACWGGLAVAAAITLSGIACVPRESRHHAWWREYGREHTCIVVGEHEIERIGRHGRLHEHEETCYRCPQDPALYCFAGPPVAGAVLVP